MSGQESPCLEWRHPSQLLSCIFHDRSSHWSQDIFGNRLWLCPGVAETDRRPLPRARAPVEVSDGAFAFGGLE